MSTRANIIISDEDNELCFYRHDDGEPATVIPSLERYTALLDEGEIRNNVEQSAGWLIILGAQEKGIRLENGVPLDKRGEYTWRVGAYEPACRIAGDIDYLYIVDLVAKKIAHVATDHECRVPKTFYNGNFAI